MKKKKLLTKQWKNHDENDFWWNYINYMNRFLEYREELKIFEYF